MIGLSSAHFVVPYNKLAFVEMALGMGILAFTTLRASGRQHKHGIVSQWTNPGVFIRMRFNESEKKLITLGLVMLLSTLLSYVSVVIVI